MDSSAAFGHPLDSNSAGSSSSGNLGSHRAAIDRADKMPQQSGGQAMAIDLSHHLSELAKARRFSPLKTFSKYMGIPGIISLAGGLPDPGYFPTEAITLSLLPTNAFDGSHYGRKAEKQGWFSSWFGSSSSKPSIQQVTIPKFVSAPTPESLQLSGALQYGGAAGLMFLQNFLREWTTRVSKPAYSDWQVLVDDGATDGWHKVLELLCNPGDPILVEAWTYPSAIESGWPMGVRPIPVAIDAEGMIPAALDHTLSEWDEQARGCKKPRLLYTVPVGQNPTGSVISAARRKAIYSVCVKHDVIIGEDSPYEYLQFTTSGQPSEKAASPAEENRRFLKSLSPSYLTFDYQGRVIRLDTFSKTIAPGSRLGWITSNARFSERLLRASEVSTQQPSGFSQIIICKILETWGIDGWVQWLRGLRDDYQSRRDVVADALQQGFKVEIQRHRASQAARMVGYAKYSSQKRTPVPTLDLDEKLASFGTSQGRPPLVDFVLPGGGMFIWVNVHVSSHKRYMAAGNVDQRRRVTRELLNELWETLAQKNLLVAPGWMFAGDGLRSGAPPEDKSLAEPSLNEFPDETQGEERGIGNFRIAFSYSTHDTLKEGIKIFCEAVTEFME